MRPLKLMCASLPLFISLSASAQRISVGTASAGLGEKATGYIEVPAGVDAATRIPVVVIRGEKPGPVLALVAGAHGTEYASIIALEKLSEMPGGGGVSGLSITHKW
jgi:predicted deacylase